MVKLLCFSLIIALAFAIGAKAGFTGWIPIGDQVMVGSPAVINIVSDRLEVFIRTATGLRHAWHQPSDRSWSSWDPLGFPAGCVSFNSDPVVVQIPNTGALFAVFIVGCDGNIHWKYQNQDRSWTNWINIGGANAGSPVAWAPGVGILPDGGFEVFARSPVTGFLMHKWRNGNSGDFNWWWDEFSGLTVNGPASVVTRPNGDIFAAAVGSPSKMVMIVRSAADQGWYSHVVNDIPYAGAFVSSAEVGRNGVDVTVWYKHYYGSGFMAYLNVSNGWSISQRVYNQNVNQPVNGFPVVAYNTDGYHVAYVRGSPDNQLVTCRLVGGCDAGLSNTAFRDNVAVGYINGNHELFARGTDEKIRHGWW